MISNPQYQKTHVIASIPKDPKPNNIQDRNPNTPAGSCLISASLMPNSNS